MSHAVQHQYKRLPVRWDPRTLHFADYAKPSLVAPPLRADSYSKVPVWPVYLNTSEGDCTIAGAGHMIQAWTQAALGRDTQVTDAQVQAAYEAISGYDPSKTLPDGSNPTDTGCVELDVLKYWRKRGIGGHKIVAYLRVDVHNHRQVKQAIATFGGVYGGFQVPASAEQQFQDGENWHVVADSPILGGHCVPLLGYDPQNLYAVTWGAVQPLTYHFLDVYFEEIWCIVTTDFLDKTGHDPQGLNLRQLLADLDALD